VPTHFHFAASKVTKDGSVDTHRYIVAHPYEHAEVVRARELGYDVNRSECRDHTCLGFRTVERNPE
jgi:hypothetical protein